MPNWCDNSFEVSHSDPKQITRFVEAFKRSELCNEFIPVPNELKDTISPNRDEQSAEQLIEKTGYADWYSFCVNEWGTKWDVGGDDGYIDFDETSARGSFQSAWSPPNGLMDKLVEEGFSVRFMYYEPGMGYCGIYEDGQDDYYEFDGMSADEIAEELPSELDECFGISESVREWEEENEEE
jgi:hypothetical protein